MESGDVATIFGDGEQVRDFVYVGDCVRFVMAGMERATTEGPVYNVCTGSPSSLLDLVDALSAAGRKPLSVEFGPERAGDIRRSFGDPGRTEAAFGFRAETSLQDGLGATLQSLNP